MRDTQNRADATGRRLNHVEFAHRPGECGLVVDLFRALGCPCFEVDTPPFGKYIVVQLDSSPHGQNDMFVSEAEPEQLAFENALHTLKNTDARLAVASEQFRRLQKERPYRATHIGIRMPSVDAFDTVVTELAALKAGKLSGRLDVGGILERTAEEAEKISAPVKQVWVWTDVISTGLLVAGQQIELQAYDT
jgi:hypothetical protein